MQKPFEISIVHEIQLSKILAFMRVGARHVRFRIPGELIDAFLSRLERWAAEQPASVALKLATPSQERTLLFGAGGAAIGGLVGGAVAGLPGVLVGAAAGAAAGVMLARYAVELRLGTGTDAYVSFGEVA